MSAHPPFRLRLTLALLVLVLAGTAVGASVLFGSNQAAPTPLATADIGLTGPPIVGGIDLNPAAAAAPGSGMRIGILDKEAALDDQRRAAAARDAEALRSLAAAQEAALAEFAAAMDAAQAAEEPRPPSPTNPPATNGGGSLYEKLDNIATCESGRNEDAYNPRGPYYGAFQFHEQTWRSYGGGPGDIRDYSYEQQREIAANLARARGFAGSWPTCAARYGYA